MVRRLRVQPGLASPMALHDVDDDEYGDEYRMRRRPNLNWADMELVKKAAAEHGAILFLACGLEWVYMPDRGLMSFPLGFVRRALRDADD